MRPNTTKASDGSHEIAEEICSELHRRFCSDVPNDGTYTLGLNETETIRFFNVAEDWVARALDAARAEVGRLRESNDRYICTFGHRHVAGKAGNIDKCDYCGLDLRDVIHARTCKPLPTP